MAFEFDGLLLLLHVLFAALWFGGGVYQVKVIGPALMLAGPNAGGFMAAVARRGGMGLYFATTGGLAILFGGALYGSLAADDATSPSWWITGGAILAVLAFLHGMFVNLPTERKLMAILLGLKGPPTPEQATQMAALGTKLGKNGVISVAMIAVTFVLMLVPRVFP